MGTVFEGGEAQISMVWGQCLGIDTSEKPVMLCMNADDVNGCQGMSTENSTPLAESIPLNTALTKCVCQVKK